MLGEYTLLGTTLFACFMALQICLGRYFSTFKAKADVKTEERMEVMNEIISGIEVIKMYAWEKSFYEKIEEIRRAELKQIRRTSWIRAMFASFKLFLSQSALFLSVLGFILSGNVLTAIYVFTITSFFNVLRQTMVASVPTAVTTMTDAWISIKRITAFLTGKEISPNRIRPMSMLPGSTRQSGEQLPAIAFLGVSAKWSQDGERNVLNKFDLEVQRKETVAITGAVGCGKTSLLQVILNEVPVINGAVYVDGTISSTAQEPWIFPGTVRENIIFREAFDPTRYTDVCRVCSLDADFRQLPQGDATILEGKGSTLSGGQKARINLARAVYREADIYLLDDPLSAVDNVVGQHIFRECIMGLLKDKCIVLVTHNQEFLRNVDDIRVYEIRNGNVERKGSCEELTDSEGASNHAHDIMGTTTVTGEEDNIINERTPLINRPTRRKDEIIRQGTIKAATYREYLRAGGCYFLGMALLFLVAHSVCAFNDNFLRNWVNRVQTIYNSTDGNHTTEGAIFGDVYESAHILYLYSFLLSTLIVFALLRSVAFMFVCMCASNNLHSNLYTGVVATKMRFFHETSQGTILNRFSSDIKSVDQDLPIQFLDFLNAVFTVSFISLMVTTVNEWMIICTILTLVIFYYIKQWCLRTLRDIKRIEDSRRSPVYDHLKATMSGITTIRAFGVQNELKDHFDDLQDMHTAPSYIGMAGMRAFGFWLEIFVVLYVALVLLSFRLFLNEEYGGNVGFAVTQAISLTGIFQYGMRQWGALETRMTAVERILEYSNLEPEETIKKTMSAEWPIHGEISFNQVSVKYFEEEDLVLEGLSFDVGKREKIGIVGRTGAGKSTILAALLRLAYIERGKITIDGVDISHIPLSILRSNISILPQEPKLFAGTIRTNLDPFGIYQDNVLWSALENVELKTFIAKRPNGLQAMVDVGGMNFSAGERQLICFARAIIMRNKILVLDEATANVDSDTDKKIQSTLARCFGDCTVLTIAHRVETVINSDRILVLDKGRRVEFDHPYQLLRNKSGTFYKLASETKTFDNLLEIARQNFNRIDGNNLE
ncbi:unnamed protein product [Acanthoscelides obtectus]|nr:unnamed protein product [Acanthoscelides obtectus]CAK1642092.1 Probable multidrug resistance-associated protein lethal(2)03659 [Acanthoscelides obtectus]